MSVFSRMMALHLWLTSIIPLSITSVQSFSLEECRAEKMVERCKYDEHDERCPISIPSGLDMEKYEGYSCHVCTPQSPEVHVLSVYDSMNDGWSTDPMIYFEGSGQSVTLVLTSNRYVKWIIYGPINVKIEKIILISKDIFISKVTLPDDSPPVPVYKVQAYIGHKPWKTSEKQDLLNMMKPYVDYFTSWTGIYRADTWHIWLGRIQEFCNFTLQAQDPTLPPPAKLPDITEHDKVTDEILNDCLAASDCWVQYNFRYDDDWKHCDGKQYVSRTKYSNIFIGVILCHNDRYSLYLSSALDGKYLRIYDKGGKYTKNWGQDHCEFVGGTDYTARLPWEFKCKLEYKQDDFDTSGYQREHYGENPEIISFNTADRMIESLECPAWYECGVSIPGDGKVVELRNPADFNIYDEGETANTTDELPEIRFNYADCFVRVNSPNARSYPLPVPEQIFSCVPSTQEGSEIHIVSVHTSNSTDDATIRTIEVDVVEPDNTSDNPVGLVLTSAQPVSWKVNVAESVQLSKIILVSYASYEEFSVEVESHSEDIDMLKLRARLGFANSTRDVENLMSILRPHVSFITSITGTRESDHWTIKPVGGGMCGSPAFLVNPTLGPTTSIPKENEDDFFKTGLIIIIAAIIILIIILIIVIAYCVRKRRKDDSASVKYTPAKAVA